MKSLNRLNCTNPQWLVYLKDGRVGLGIGRYRRKNKTYYVVTGWGFYMDDVRPDEIAKRITV